MPFDVQVVTVDRHPVDDLVVAFETLALGRDDSDVVPGSDERRGLHPHPTIEGHGEILDDDEDSTRRCHHTRSVAVVE